MRRERVSRCTSSVEEKYPLHGCARKAKPAGRHSRTLAATDWAHTGLTSGASTTKAQEPAGAFPRQKIPGHFSHGALRSVSPGQKPSETGPGGETITRGKATA